MSYNILHVVRDVVTGKLKFTPRSEAKRRRDVCDMCEARSPLNVCTVCGCFLPLKIRVKASECPMDMWLGS